MTYLIANWKMNLPPEGVESYLANIGGADPRDVTMVVAPPYPFLRHVVECGGVSVAAQNCSDQPAGAFTGEVSPAMIRECGADSVILGHSERRNLFHETDAVIARKLALAIATGLRPILCIGEDLRVRDSGEVSRFLADQLKTAAIDTWTMPGRSSSPTSPSGPSAPAALPAERSWPRPSSRSATP
jgi:triosephosphate isomerase (TIM)